MAEFEPNAFLRELDSFGRPPPPQKLITEEGHSPLVTRDIAAKLNALNIQKQKKITPRSLGNGMTRLGEQKERVTPISQDEIRKWKNTVLEENRPRNQWADHQRVSPTESRQRAKELRSGVDLSPLESPKGTELRLFTPDADSALSTSSNSPQSRQLSSAAASSPQSSTSSSGENHRPPGYRYSPALASLNALNSNSSPYKDSTNGHRSGYSSQTSPSTSVDTAKSPLKTPVNRGFPRNGAPPPPIEDRPSVLQQRRVEPQKPLKTSAERGDELVKKNEKWTRLNCALDDSNQKYFDLTSRLQREMDAERGFASKGSCLKCRGPLSATESVTEALGARYHHRCFNCDVCGKPLRDLVCESSWNERLQKFFRAGDKILCEEDYRYEGALLESTDRCATCKQPIVDMILQALGRSYHPRCFRCCVCSSCLDGVPFALDTAQQVYCLNDYHKLFSPKCSKCRNSILPDQETGETVRVVALGNDYHVECYTCEGCGVQLTDEPKKRCFPINNHLLCEDCHVHWARTGGDKKPITDL